MAYIYKNLYQMIVEKEVSFKTIADLISVSEEEFCAKLQGLEPWYLPEAMLICQYFKTSDVKNLFII